MKQILFSIQLLEKSLADIEFCKICGMLVAGGILKCVLWSETSETSGPIVQSSLDWGKYLLGCGDWIGQLGYLAMEGCIVECCSVDDVGVVGVGVVESMLWAGTLASLTGVLDIDQAKYLLDEFSNYRPVRSHGMEDTLVETYSCINPSELVSFWEASHHIIIIKLRVQFTNLALDRPLVLGVLALWIALNFDNWSQNGTPFSP